MKMVFTGRRGAVGRVVVLLPLGVALCCALAMGLVATAWVSASPESQLTISPSQGAVGTAVTVTLVAQMDSVGQSYKLVVSMVDANTGAPCDPGGVQPIPGVAPFIIAAPTGGQPAGATINFSWPTALDYGPYWLCAVPAASSGIAYMSSNQFTVVGAMPTATPLPTASAVVNASLSGVKAGAKFTISISHWSALSSTPPQAVIFTTSAPSGTNIIAANSATVTGTNASFTTAPGSGPGDYTLTVTVPKVDPTVYYIAVETSEQAYVFGGVVAVQAPAAPPTQATPAPTPGSGNGSSPSLLVVGILLAIILLMLAAVLLRLRMRRQRAARQLRERAARDQYLREQHYRQQQTYNQPPRDQWGRPQYPGQQYPSGRQPSEQWPQQQQPSRDQWSREQQQRQPQPPQPSREEWARTQRPSRDPRYPQR